MAAEAALKIKIGPELDAAKVNGTLSKFRSMLVDVNKQGVKISVNPGETKKAIDELLGRFGSLTGGIGKVDSALAGMGGKARNEFGQFVAGAKEAGGAVDGIAGVLGKAKGLLAGAAIGAGLTSAGKAAVSANAEMETFETQIGTLIKGTADFKEKYKGITDQTKLQAAASAEAKKRIAELAKFGADTPFDLPGIASAEKVLLGFGLTGRKAMQLTGKSAEELRTVVGDVSAGTGVKYDELAVTLGKFSTGATGEAISRLQELGVATKEELKAAGIEFDKAGSLTSPVDKALTATVSIMQNKFGGGMAQLSQTFSGQLSTLQDGAEAALRDMGKPIFDTLKTAIGELNKLIGNPETQAAIQKIGGALAPIAGLITSILGDLLKGLTPILGSIADLVAQLLGPISEVVGSVVGSISDILVGIAGPLGNLLHILAGTLLQVIQPLVNAFLPIIGQIADLLVPIIGLVASLLAAFLPLITVALLPTTTVLQILFRVFGALLGSITPFITIIASLAGMFAEKLAPILSEVAGLISEFAALFGEVFAEAVTLAKRVIDALIKGFGSFILQLFGVKGGTDLLTKATEFMRKAMEKVHSVLETVHRTLGGLRAAFAVVKTTIADFLEALSNADIAGAIKAFAGFGDKVTKAYKDGSKAAEEFKDKVTEDVAPVLPPLETKATAKEEKKDKTTAYELAKRTFEVEKGRLENTQKTNEINRETARINEKRAKSTADDLVNERERLQTLETQLSRLNALLKVNRSGKIGIKLESKEVKDAEGMLNGLRQQVQEQRNKFSELRLKLFPDVDESEIAKLQEERIKIDIELGKVDASALDSVIQSDIDSMKAKLAEFSTSRLQALKELREKELITDAEFFQLQTRILTNGEKEQLELLNKIASREAELKKAQYERESQALEKKIKKEEELQTRASEQQKRIIEAVTKIAESVGSARIDAQAKDAAFRLDAAKKKELISEERFNELKAKADAKAAKQAAVLQSITQGQKLEAERRLALEQLSVQQQRLEAQKKLAEQAGDAKAAAELGEQLDSIGEQMRTKGSFISGIAEDLQGNLTDLMTNLFSGDPEKIKDPFRKSFAIVAGALQRLATAKITEVILGSISGLGGIAGLLVALAGKPIIEGLIGGLLGPIVSNLLSFATGGRIDGPTLALVGDASRLGGGNREWIFRDEQLRAVMSSVVAANQGGMLGTLQSIERGINAMAERDFVLRGSDIVGASTRSQRNSKRRRFDVGGRLVTQS